MKIAQYSQWDGYYEGQGQKIRRFLENLHTGEYDKEQFLNNLRSCSFFKDDAELNALPGINEDGWAEKYPWLSRDAGGDIFHYVHENANLKLMDRFAMHCDTWIEYVYVVDFDKNTFEVYSMYTDIPIPEGERFYGAVPYSDGKPDTRVRKTRVPKLRHAFNMKFKISSEEFMNTLVRVEVNSGQWDKEDYQEYF